MVRDIILKIEESMSRGLDPFQMKALHNELINNLIEVDIMKNDYSEINIRRILSSFFFMA